MKYMGSKARFVNEILPIILKDRKENQWFVDLFCGGCSIAQEVDGKVIANDKNIAGTAAVIGGAAGQVSIKTATDAAGTAGAWPTGFTLNADGTISVASGTAAGTYTLEIVTQFSSGTSLLKEPRTASFEKILTVQ